MDNQFKMWITEGIKELSVDISEDQVRQFYQYYELLIEWNQVMNLTAITDMKQVVYKHFVDSVSLVRAFDGRDTLRHEKWTVMDVGTGAGFPGIPLKIMFPGFRITLLDSLNKRVKFLNEVIEKLELKDISAVHGRAEDLGRNADYRECYDLCVSRAVANLATLSEYCIPFVKKGGMFVSYKSGTAEDEIDQARKAVRTLGGEMKNIVSFRIGEIDADRSLVCIEKRKSTSLKYPRKAGVPGKEPL